MRDNSGGRLAPRSRRLTATTRTPPVAAVVVAYNPDSNFTHRISTLARQVGVVVIVDNASTAASRAPWAWAERRAGFEVIMNDQNIGIGAALNQGVAWARRQGYGYVLTLDQDTTPGPTMVEELAGILLDRGISGEIGMVGANYRDTNTGKEAASGSGKGHMESFTVITSGSLLPAEAYERVGPFREDLFIDLVDIEYCLRLRAHGYRILMSSAPLMDHSLGQGHVIRVAGKRLACMNQPASRKYYASRNRLIVFREFMRSEPRWALGEIGRIYQETALIVLFEDGKRRKLRAILLGIVDYMRGVAGPLPPDADL